MERIIRSTFYWGQAIMAALFVIFAVSYTLMNVFRGADFFIVVCFGVMSYTNYKLMFIPSLAELSAHRRRVKKQ